MLRAVWPGHTADVRELLVQSQSTAAAHEVPLRSTPPEIAAGYRINEALTIPEPASIAIVDDVLTTGAHFRAACSALTARFPAVWIVGLFIARRVPDTDPPI